MGSCQIADISHSYLHIFNLGGRGSKVELELLEVKKKGGEEGVPIVAQWLMNPSRNHEVVGSIPGLLTGLRIQHCHELWCSSQTQVGSHIAVALE